MNIKQKRILKGLFKTAFIFSIGLTHVWAEKFEIDKAFISEKFYLPSINEIHNDANAAGITKDWGKLIKLTPKDYTSFSVAGRAFEVGKTLSDVAFITLSVKDKQQPPPKNAIDIAYSALTALKLPKDVETSIQILKEEAASGKLKGKDLRKKLDNLISQTIAKIEEDKDQAIRDSGSLLLAAGFYKAFYLGAMTVSSYKNPTPEQLSMFKWDALTAYFIDYFTNKASNEYKNNKTVKIFVASLKSITPIVNKDSKEITKEDVAKIHKSLIRLFK